MDLRGLLMAMAMALSIAVGGPARALDLPVTPSAASFDQLLAENGAAWTGVVDSAIDLNRTPPLYEGDPLDDGIRPVLKVAVIRASGRLFARMRWTDPTESLPRPPEKVADAGAAPIYKEHSLDIERFADAACVMVPQGAVSMAALPSLMMGEAGQPVNLYYWNRTRGFERLEAAGRGTTTRTGEAFNGQARRTREGWEVVFELPDQPASTPLAFAVWDGDRTQRDGLKFYSLWCELAR